MQSARACELMMFQQNCYMISRYSKISFLPRKSLIMCEGQMPRDKFKNDTNNSLNFAFIIRFDTISINHS